MSALQVDGYPGTRSQMVPFTAEFNYMKAATPAISKCNAAGHCTFAYDITVKAVSVPGAFGPGVSKCATTPTELLTYDGIVPGPLIYAPV